jgi:hypothetical protein
MAKTIADRIKARRLPNVDAPQVQDKSLRQYMEGVKEHLRMYEGDSGAPKERFVTVEELETAGLVSTKIQQGFALITEALGTPIGTPATDGSIGSGGSGSGSSSGGSGGGSGGSNTFVGLEDTRVAGAKRYDLTFKADANWHSTNGLLLWNPTAKYLQLANQHSINWLDSSGASVELLTFDSEFTVGDPTFATRIDGTLVGLRNNVGVNWEGSGAVDVEMLILEGASFESGLPGGAALMIQMDFEDGAEGGTTTVNIGSADDPTFASTAEIAAVAGYNSSFGFHNVSGGSDSLRYMEVDAAGGDTFDFDGGDYTFYCWYQAKGPSGNIAQTKTSGWRLDFYSNRIVLALGVSEVELTSVTDKTTDTWYHIAFTRSGTSVRLFINGVLEASGDDAAISYQNTSITMSFGIAHEEYLDDIVLIKGYAQWAADDSFTPPTIINADVQEFVVGDTAINTRIDGLATNITSASTALDGTLSAVGAADLQSTLNVDGASTLHAVTIWDTTDVGSAVFTHDLTDFNTAFALTTDWNITGLAAMVLDNTTAVSWLDPLGAAVEMLEYVSVGTADPDWASVTLLADFDGADAATLYSATDRIATFFSTAAIDTAQSKFGGSSLFLDGSSDYVQFQHDAAIGLLNGEDITIEFQVRLSSLLTADAEILNKSGVSGSIWSNYSIAMTSTEKVRFIIYHNGGSDIWITSTSTIAVDTWTHVAAIWDDVADTAYLYINGVLEAQATATFTIFDNGGPLTVGHQVSASGDYFPGHIDDLRITKGIRYAVDFAPPAVALPSVDRSWNSVSVLADFNGADAATTYTSEDTGLRTATFAGNAQLDTAQFKFGTSSLLCDGTGDYITFPDSTDFDLGSGDFTIEAWVRHSDITGIQYYCARYDVNGVSEASYAFAWTASTGDLFFLSSALGTGDIVVTTGTTPWTPTVGVWHHVAVTRDSGTLRMFADGAKLYDATLATNLFAASTSFDIGSISGGSGYTHAFEGHMSELRLTKGVARYTAAFTPPVASFPLVDPTPSAEMFTVGAPTVNTQIDGPVTQVTGELEFLGKMNTNPTTVTATSFTADDEHVILADDDTAGSTVTITLPPAATAESIYHIKKLGTTASVIVDADGTETIDGALTATLNTQYESIMLVSDGSNWHVI